MAGDGLPASVAAEVRSGSRGSLSSSSPDGEADCASARGPVAIAPPACPVPRRTPGAPVDDRADERLRGPP